MNRRNFLVGVGSLALDLAITINANADGQECRSRPGYRMYIYDYNNNLPNYLELIGKEAPPFSGVDINPKSKSYGRHIGPQDYRGKIVAINFWELHCKPCREELPDFEEVYRSRDDFVVLAVQTNESDIIGGLTFPILSSKGRFPISLRVCVKDSEVSYSNYRSGRLYDDMGWLLWESIYGTNNPLPVTFLVDRNGIVRDVVNGSIKKQELEEKIKIIAENDRR